MLAFFQWRQAGKHTPVPHTLDETTMGLESIFVVADGASCILYMRREFSKFFTDQANVAH
jgi:hypothetical protein